jgi:folylpolyglutamate synthase/dihydropteroate synthase
MKQDKDISVLRDKLAPLFSHVIATEGSYEPMPAAELAAALHHSSTEVILDPRAAAERGYELIGANGSLVITGSLYMIPPALEYLRNAVKVKLTI